MFARLNEPNIQAVITKEINNDMIILPFIFQARNCHNMQKFNLTESHSKGAILDSFIYSF